MSTFIASINAILIVFSMLSCISSLPTPNQNSEVELDEASSSSEESSRCFELVQTSPNQPIRNMNFAVDSEGKVCIERFDSRRFRYLVSKADEIDIRFENATSDFCPTWPQSKQCLMDHLNSDRCNEDDRTEAMDFKALNQDIVFAELLCNPLRSSNFLNLVKDTLKERLWGCLDLEETERLFKECIDKKLLESGYKLRFQDQARFFHCATPGLRKCANGDAAREAKLVQLWVDFDRQYQEAHRDFWN